MQHPVVGAVVAPALEDLYGIFVPTDAIQSPLRRGSRSNAASEQEQRDVEARDAISVKAFLTLVDARMRRY